jgi:hypothetical protein
MIKPSVQDKIVLVMFIVTLAGIFFPMFSSKGNNKDSLIAIPSKSLPGTGPEMIVESKNEK